MQCLFHTRCVIVEYKKQREVHLMGLEGSGVWESGANLNLNSSSTSLGLGVMVKIMGLRNQVGEETKEGQF